MRADNMSQHVAPVIAVLDVISVGKAFSPVVAEGRLVQGIRRERVRLIPLQRECEVLVGLRKRWTSGWSTIVNGVPEKLTVDAILLEVLIDADIVLLCVVVVGTVEISCVEYR